MIPTARKIAAQLLRMIPFSTWESFLSKEPISVDYLSLMAAIARPGE
jgi:hypothetical protein